MFKHCHLYINMWAIHHYMIHTQPFIHQYVSSTSLHGAHIALSTSIHDNTSLHSSHTALCTSTYGQYIIAWFTHCPLYINIWTLHHCMVYTLPFIHQYMDSTSLHGSHTVLCTSIYGHYTITWFTHCPLYINTWTVRFAYSSHHQAPTMACASMWALNPGQVNKAQAACSGLDRVNLIQAKWRYWTLALCVRLIYTKPMKPGSSNKAQPPSPRIVPHTDPLL